MKNYNWLKTLLWGFACIYQHQVSTLANGEDTEQVSGIRRMIGVVVPS